MPTRLPVTVHRAKPGFENRFSVSRQPGNDVRSGLNGIFVRDTPWPARTNRSVKPLGLPSDRCIKALEQYQHDLEARIKYLEGQLRAASPTVVITEEPARPQSIIICTTASTRGNACKEISAHGRAGLVIYSSTAKLLEPEKLKVA